MPGPAVKDRVNIPVGWGDAKFVIGINQFVDIIQPCADVFFLLIGLDLIDGLDSVPNIQPNGFR